MTASDVAAIRCGLHSGFPRCCIRFFIGPGTQMSDADRATYFETTPGVGYMPCPACVASGTFVKVKPCPFGSHGGNVIDHCESLYERVDGRIVCTKAEYFYRDRPGSFCLQVVDGVVTYDEPEPQPESTS